MRDAHAVAPIELDADVGDVAVVGLPDEKWGERVEDFSVADIPAEKRPAQLG